MTSLGSAVAARLAGSAVASSATIDNTPAVVAYTRSDVGSTP